MENQSLPLKSVSWEFSQCNILGISFCSSVLIWSMVSLFWFTPSPSIGLICIAVFSLLSGGCALLLHGVSVMGVLFIVLTIIGGLFILISFTVLSFPQDLEVKGASSFSLAKLSQVCLLAWSGAVLVNTNPKSGVGPTGKEESFSILVGSSFHELALLSILFLLLLFLFMVDSMVSHNGGTFFSSEN